MKKTLIAAALAGLALPTGLAHAAPDIASATITLNGQNIPVNGQVRCGELNTGGFAIQAGHDNGAANVELVQENTVATSVDITDTDGTQYDWARYETVRYRGDAQLATSGKTYKITGHIPKTHLPPSQAPVIGGGAIANAPLEPFEIDVTCP